ncbi:MAG: hypothetical protein H6865_00315 [Rhodospirillales bacterium]|nr:hypothetical protein [Alphaproteobacteria bacterium]MCB9986069.1 hypothetical protein [Rhodospirillales bacterium]USO07364.1 MAG: hypothetical protein H6866_08060 [Rhodospirillales bacterium]
MDHARGKEIFAQIQARPYSLSTVPGVPSDNCYFKGVELLQRLGVLGYAVRGRVGETYWDDRIFPPEIVALLPADILTTHFFVEALIDGAWRALDPSFQPGLAKYGLTIGSWDNGLVCFPVTRLYTQEESIAYQQKWFDPEYQKDFFERGGACWRALDVWFKKA